MNCPRCDRVAGPGQRFCNGCGLQLRRDDATVAVDRSGAARPQAPRPGGQRATSHRAHTDDLDPPAGRPVVQRKSLPADGDLPMTPPSGPPVVKRRRVVSAATNPGAHSGRANDDAGRLRPPETTVGSTNDIPITPAAEPTPGRQPYRPPSSATRADPPPDATAANYIPPTPSSPPPATAVLPATRAGDSPPRWRRFRFNTTTVLGIVLGVLAITGIFLRIVSITTRPAVQLEGELPYAFRLGSWTLGDVGSNLPMAALIIGVTALAGAAAAGFGWHWGAGLVGGAALSFVGFAALAIGLTQLPIEGAHEFARIPTKEPFNVLIVRDIGYWMLIGTGAIAVVALFASLNECFSDRQRDLNPWIAAVGALAVVATVAGVMLPAGQAVFSDNWYVIQGVGEAPPLLVAGRLVQLGAFLIAGVTGFLLVRPYGLGLAIGGTAPSIWLGVSVLLQPGQGVGPGWRNPGASTVDLHGLTIIGLATLVSMLVLACLSAYNQYALRSERAASSSEQNAPR